MVSRSTQNKMSQPDSELGAESLQNLGAFLSKTARSIVTRQNEVDREESSEQKRKEQGMKRTLASLDRIANHDLRTFYENLPDAHPAKYKSIEVKLKFDVHYAYFSGEEFGNKVLGALRIIFTPPTEKSQNVKISFAKYTPACKTMDSDFGPGDDQFHPESDTALTARQFLSEYVQHFLPSMREQQTGFADNSVGTKLIKEVVKRVKEVISKDFR